MRRWFLVLICHAYPSFIFLHLVYGNWSLASQLIFNCVPIIVFGGVIKTWQLTGDKRLDKLEKFCLGYLFLMVAIIYCYYILCTVSNASWVIKANFRMGLFIFITFIYYIYNLAKSEQ